MSADLKAALAYVSPDTGRDEWLRVLMGIKSELGDEGRALAEEWSAGGETFDPRAFSATWRSIRADGGITGASVFHAAKAAGWRPDKPMEMRTRRPQKTVQRAQEPAPTLPYARAIWQRVDRSDSAIAGHPYAIKKRIRHAAGAGRAIVTGSLVGERADCVVVPMRTLAGELVGVECINQDGKKQTFGNKGILILGNDLDPKLPQLVVEGWACAVAWFLLYRGHIAVYAAFTKSRLRTVAEQVEAKYPSRTIVICREADA